MNTRTKDFHSLLSRSVAEVAKYSSVDAVTRSRIKATLHRLAAHTVRLTRSTLRIASLEAVVNLLLWAVWLFVLVHCLKFFLR